MIIIITMGGVGVDRWGYLQCEDDGGDNNNNNNIRNNNSDGW